MEGTAVLQRIAIFGAFSFRKTIKFGSTVAYFCEIEKCIVPAKHIPKCRFYAENANKMCISIIYASFFNIC